MRIALDARSYFMRTGIARYTRGLTQALMASPGDHQWLLLISDQHEPSELPFDSAVVDVRSSAAPWLGGGREREVLEDELRAWRADLFHAVFPPHGLAGVPSVTTVFDFSPISHPELHQAPVRRAFEDAWTSAARASRGFVGVSERTSRLVEDAIGRSRPVWTIPCGLTPPFDRAPSRGGSGTREGVLFVGTIEPRKNVGLLLEAMQEVHRRGHDVPLTLVGKRGWGCDDFDRLLAATPQATWLGFVDDESLLEQYRRAAIVATPSVLEGFGLPVLEGMAQGALPLVGPDPALGEVVGRSDLQVQPSAGAWADAILRWIGDEPAREAAAAALTRRASAYTWPAIAARWHTLSGALS